MYVTNLRKGEVITLADDITIQVEIEFSNVRGRNVPHAKLLINAPKEILITKTKGSL